MHLVKRLKQRIRRSTLGISVFMGAFFVQFLVLNLIARTEHFAPHSGDMRFYHDWAQRIATGTLTQEELTSAFYGLPGYAYFLAGVYQVTGGFSDDFTPFLIGQIQAVVHAFTALFIFLIGQRVFKKPGTAPEDVSHRGTVIGIAAATAWTLSLSAQVFTSILMPTCWLVCSYWGCTYWVIKSHQEKSASWWRPWLFIGLVVGLTATLVATIFMLLPLIVVAILILGARHPSRGRRLLSITGALGILLIGVYVACSPVWFHNRFIAKDDVFLTAHDGVNLYLGNHAGANGYPKIPDGIRASQEGLLKDSMQIPQQEAGRRLKRSEISAYWKKKAQTFITEDYFSWMRLMGVKFANFWNIYQYDDLSLIKLLRNEGAIPLSLRFGLAAALGIPGLIFCGWRFLGARWVGGAVLLHMIALMPVFITERYRLAALPGLWLLSAGYLWMLWDNLVSRRWIITIPQILLLGAATWFVSNPQTDISLWSLDFYNPGIRAANTAQLAFEQSKALQNDAEAARKNGDTKMAELLEHDSAEQSAISTAHLDQAQQSLETAYAYVQNNAEINFALGNIWFHRKDFARAKLFYHETLKLTFSTRPHDGALNNLGIIALEEKQWSEAQFYFEKSLRVDPTDARTWYNLADTSKELGDIQHAQLAIAQAIALHPENPSFHAFQAKLRQQPIGPVKPPNP